MSNTRRQSLRVYLLHAAFAMLIGAAVLPVLQLAAPAIMAEIGIDPASPGMLAFLGGYLGGSLYTACRWIDQIAAQQHWEKPNPVEMYFRQTFRRRREMTAGLILIACLFLFVPIYLTALVWYRRA